jgi:pyruvate,water dikinase
VAPEGLLDAYRQVIASLYSTQAIFYRLHMGIREDEVAMAVGCVEMVDALAAGVAFSRDPVHPGLDDVVIHAVWGLGPSVVDGRVSPDIYRVSRQNWTAKVTIGHKGSQLVVDPEAGIHEEPVEEEMQDKACLEPSEIETLGRWVEMLENHFGGPQDVEWALDRRCRLVLLQSRPMRWTAAQTGGKTEPIPGFEMLLEAGEIAAPGVGCGVAVHVRTTKDLASFPKGGVLVARHSSPEYVQVMDRAAAIVTDVGSTIGHMASLAREFGIPTLLDAKVATKVIPGGNEVTVDARQGRVYLGRVGVLLGEETNRAFMKGTPLFHDLEAIAKLIVPLNLVSPDAPSFRPEECRTLHDIARFVHEKAFAEMFRIGTLIDNLPSQAVQLDVPLPIDLYIIDLGGGLSVAPGQRKVKRHQITSYPLAQLVKGMLQEGIPRFGARPMDAGGFLDIMFRHAMSNPEADASFHQPSYAIVSDKYMNFASRVGYHFSALDCFCGKTTSKNYISFRFKGGAAEIARRSRRVRVIGEILSEMGFKTTVREDLLYARVQKYSRDEIGEKIEMVGRLFQFFRQMDLAMVSEAEADYYRDAFLQGNYALDPEFQPVAGSGTTG